MLVQGSRLLFPAAGGNFINYAKDQYHGQNEVLRKTAKRSSAWMNIRLFNNFLPLICSVCWSPQKGGIHGVQHLNDPLVFQPIRKDWTFHFLCCFTHFPLWCCWFVPVCGFNSHNVCHVVNKWGFHCKSVSFVSPCGLIEIKMHVPSGQVWWEKSATLWQTAGLHNGWFSLICV